MAELKMREISKSYDKNQILHSITLDVKSGEFLSLLGPSGSGKTTLLRCIAGLETPDRTHGEIRVGNQVLSNSQFFLPPEKRNLGMVFQNYAVWPHLNVWDNVCFPLRLQKKSRYLTPKDIQDRGAEAIACVKLQGLENRFSFQLSGGQQQRVALARALAMSPQILLLDEPLSNLDALLREELGSEIRRIQQKLKLTTILVTHDQKEALSLSDRVVILNHGHIEAQGTPETLYAEPKTPFVAEFLSAGWHRCQRCKAPVY